MHPNVSKTWITSNALIYFLYLLMKINCWSQNFVFQSTWKRKANQISFNGLLWMLNSLWNKTVLKLIKVDVKFKIRSISHAQIELFWLLFTVPQINIFWEAHLLTLCRPGTGRIDPHFLQEVIRPFFNSVILTIFLWEVLLLY